MAENSASDSESFIGDVGGRDRDGGESPPTRLKPMLLSSVGKWTS